VASPGPSREDLLELGVAAFIGTLLVGAAILLLGGRQGSTRRQAGEDERPPSAAEGAGKGRHQHVRSVAAR
jgi:hypothetical protein